MAQKKRKSPKLDFTAQDYELFDMITKVDTLKFAAQKLGRDPQSVYNRGRVIKRNIREARAFINKALAQSRRNPKIKSFVWPKVHAPERTEEESEENES